MPLRGKLRLASLLFIWCNIIPGEGFLLPLLLPLSIRITFNSHSKPTRAPTYHFEAVPVYREVVVKGSAHISPIKQSYGDGHKYGTSYGDGHLKVYTEEPHIKGHKYATGYSSGTGGSIDGHFSITSYPKTDYKGNSYDGNAASYYKGQPYIQTHYEDVTGGGTYDQGVDYVGEIPSTHYKGTAYTEKPTHYNGAAYSEKVVPQTHYKGTTYGDKIPPAHYKGTAYEEDAPTHYKGTSYEDTSNYNGKPKLVYNNHAYIKAVGGGYKYSDYVNPNKDSKYQDEEDAAYIVVPPGKSYAEIEAAHKASYTPKAYAAEEYSDLGSKEHDGKGGYEHDASYIDDTLPKYKGNIPKPKRQRPQYRYHQQASASRYDRLLPEPSSKEETAYAGFGTSIYGDSYAKVVYVPKTLRISIRAYAHK